MLHQDWTRYAVWTISIATVFAIVLRPRRLPEALWAVLGALALVVLRLVPPGDALAAIARGGQVYAFLLGMLLLARLLEHEGVFAWLAEHALRAAGGSRGKLFGLIFGVGVVVTIFLSNDATAVVLTPAVAFAVRKAGLRPYAYLYVCAFVANAASFVLPISNPANLVVFGGQLPALAAWLAAFGLPSIVSIAATFLVLRWLARRELRGGFTVPTGSPPCLTAGGRLAGICAALAALLLVAANAFGLPVGVATLGLALVALAIVTLADHSALQRDVRGVNYGIVPLVAGLFVLVQGLDRSGAIGATHALLVSATGWGVPGGPLGLGILITLACNLFNNLPVGLVAGLSLGGSEVTPVVRHAALIAVDLGPNLALSGSLATLIWRDALAADVLEMDAGRFLRVGAVVLPPALLLTLLILR